MNAYHPNLIPFTGGHEGKVLRWYRDPTGTPTIGYGSTWASTVFRQWWLTKHGRKMKPGDRITAEDALHVLRLTIEAEYLPPVVSAVHAAKANASPHAIAAATDMAYNCGPRALSWSWFKLLLAGKVKASADRYRVTARTSKGRKLPGLVRRRAEGATILAHNVWPRWLTTPKSGSTADTAKAMPSWRLLAEDVMQGQRWLKQLDYYGGPADGRDSDALRAAVLAFQKQHPQLDDDGILGRATLDQLQRVIDLKRKSAQTGAAGGSGAAAGAADQVTAVSGYGDLILYGGLIFLVIGGAWLAWRYRDELAIAFKGAGALTKGVRP